MLSLSSVWLLDSQQFPLIASVFPVQQLAAAVADLAASGISGAVPAVKTKILKSKKKFSIHVPRLLLI